MLEANRQFAAQFPAAGLTSPPKKRLAVLTCMDSRMQPERFLGLDYGDAHIIRNGGGRASDDALRSLILSHHLLGTQEYAVIHHTDCGMLTNDNQGFRTLLRERTGADPGSSDFLFFDDLEESVRNDMRRIRECPFFSQDVSVHGFIYDVQTGLLSPVED